MTSTIILGSIFSISANIALAARNFFGKGMQLTLTILVSVIWLVEYNFIFHSSTYMIITSFTLVYLIAYQFKKQLILFLKVDLIFVFMVGFILLAVVISIVIYEGPASIYGIAVMFLDLFGAFFLTSQGLRYKNSVVSILYFLLDIGIGNPVAVVLDVVNFFVPIGTIVKHRKEKVIDREGLKEHSELIKFSADIRKLKRQRHVKGF